MAANCAIRTRYSPTVSSTMLSYCARENSLLRAAMRMLAASRFTSHSRGARQRLVEVVDVEHEAPLRLGAQPEVREVRVPAALHPEAGLRRVGEVCGHDQRCAPEEGERGGQHAAVADRHELGNLRLRLALEEIDGVGPRPTAGSKAPWPERGTCRRAARPSATLSATES